MRKYCKAVVNLAVAAVIFLGIVFLVPRAFVFFSPFVVGWIIALIAGPLVRFFEEKVKLKRKIGSAFVIVVVIALVVLLLYGIVSMLFQQIAGLISELPQMWAGMETDLQNIGKSLEVLLDRLPGDTQAALHNVAENIGLYLGDFFGQMGTPTIEAAGNVAKQLPGIFIGVIMALLSAYFFVAERHQINAWCRKHAPAPIQMRYRLVCQSLSDSVGGYLKAQLKIEVWMYLLLVVGLGILRVNYFVLIALGIAFLDFLPFFGTGTVMVPWAIIKILAADYKMAIGLLIIWGGGQLARQLIQPKIVGDSIGVAPLPTLFLLYIGYKVGGVFGMIIAVPLGLLAYTMYQDGVFDTTRSSLMILVAGINRFRRLDGKDLGEVEEMEKHNRETLDRMEALRREEEEMRYQEKAEARQVRWTKKEKKKGRRS